MTLPPWEEGPEFIPPPPQVSALAQTLARLTQACWASGRAETTTLSRGLTLTAYLLDDELHLALTRQDSEPSQEEAETVAREAGWPHHEQAWRTGGSGRRGLVLTRASGQAPPAASPKAPPSIRELLLAHKRVKPPTGDSWEPELTQAQWEAATGRTVPRDEIVALLSAHPDRSYPPALAAQAQDAHRAHLKNLSVPALLDELDWYWSHWPARRGEGFPELQNVMKSSFP